MKQINISLASISAVFFMMPLSLALMSIIHYSSGYLLLITSGLLGIISFFGSARFFIDAKAKSGRWYLGIPLCITILMIMIMSLLMYLSGKSFLSDPINTIDSIWILSLLMLSPCSILLFLSLPKGTGKLNDMAIALSSAISIISVVLHYFVLKDILSIWPTVHAMIGILFLYWFVGLPIIGICILAVSVKYGNKASGQPAVQA